MFHVLEMLTIEESSGAINDVLLRFYAVTSGIRHKCPPKEAVEPRVGNSKNNIILNIFCLDVSIHSLQIIRRFCHA
jgi:hypothetical protein